MQPKWTSKTNSVPSKAKFQYNRWLCRECLLSSSFALHLEWSAYRAPQQISFALISRFSWKWSKIVENGTWIATESSIGWFQRVYSYWKGRGGPDGTKNIYSSSSTNVILHSHGRYPRPWQLYEIQVLRKLVDSDQSQCSCSTKRPGSNLLTSSVETSAPPHDTVRNCKFNSHSP